jgi:hypothetical protein
MVRQVILTEASIDKMRNMGIPPAIAKFVHSLLPKDCAEQSFWFAKQFKESLHQWDDEIGKYKEGIKQAKKIKKAYIKAKEKSQVAILGMPEGTIEEELEEWGARIKRYEISDADIETTDDPKRTFFTLGRQYVQSRQRYSSALARLRRVLAPSKDSINNICKWAVETNLNLSKRKTVEITYRDEDGIEKKKKAPFDIAAAEKLANKHFGLQEGEVFMEFPNGWYWLDRKKNMCSIEAKLMHHCGRTDNNASTLWSLRDEQGMPHVTAEVEGTEDGRIVHQMKGKQNESPIDEYHPYIYAMLKNPKFKLRYYQAKGRWGGDLKWDDIPEEQQQIIAAGAHEDFDPAESSKTEDEKIQDEYDRLTTELDEAGSVELNHVSADYDLSDDAYTDFEDGNEYISIPIYARLSIEVSSENLDRYGTGLPKNWVHQLTSLTSKFFEDNGVSEEIDISLGYYRGSINFRWFVYEDLYDSDDYRSLLEEYREGLDLEYNKLESIADRFMVFHGIDEPNEEQSYGYMSTYLQYASELHHFTKTIDNEHIYLTTSTRIRHLPQSWIDLDVTHDLTEKIIKRFRQIAEEEGTSLPENLGKITLKHVRGEKQAILNIKLAFILEADEDADEEERQELLDDNNEVMKFALWAASDLSKTQSYGSSAIRRAMEEVIPPATKDPYLPNIITKNADHVKEYILRSDNWYKEIINSYTGDGVGMRAELSISSYNIPNIVDALTLWEDTHSSSPRGKWEEIVNLNSNSYQFKVVFKKKPGEQTLSQWAAEIDMFMEEYRRMILEITGKDMAETTSSKITFDLIWKKHKERAKTQIESVIRAYIRESL